WLLSGWWARASWTAALGFFGILASTSLYMALTGQRSCGCFAPISVSPWWTLALDVAALTSLGLFRPRRTASGVPTAWLERVVRIAVGGAVLLVLLAGALLVASRDPMKTLARLRGESISVEPAVSYVGEGTVGEVRTFHIDLANQAEQAIRIVGGTTTCG